MVAAEVGEVVEGWGVLEVVKRGSLDSVEEMAVDVLGLEVLLWRVVLAVVVLGLRVVVRLMLGGEGMDLEVEALVAVSFAGVE